MIIPECHGSGFPNLKRALKGVRDKSRSRTGLGQHGKVEVEEDKVHRHRNTKQVEGTKQCVNEEIHLQYDGFQKDQ